MDNFGRFCHTKLTFSIDCEQYGQLWTSLDYIMSGHTKLTFSIDYRAIWTTLDVVEILSRVFVEVGAKNVVLILPVQGSEIEAARNEETPREREND